jgi:hypothetical protein
VCTENVIRVDDVMGSPKLADYPDVVCKTRQNGALKHALNGRCCDVERAVVESEAVRPIESRVERLDLASATLVIALEQSPFRNCAHQNPAPDATSPAASATDRDVAPSLTPAAVRTYSPERSALFLLPTNVVVGPSPPLQVD